MPIWPPTGATSLKLGANWQPLAETDLKLRGEYVRTRLDDPISSFPGATAELEAAFPDRFVRDGGGELVTVDLRPVNFDSARRDTLRIGFDFTKPLRSAAPSPRRSRLSGRGASRAGAKRRRRGHQRALMASAGASPAAARFRRRIRRRAGTAAG